MLNMFYKMRYGSKSFFTMLNMFYKMRSSEKDFLVSSVPFPPFSLRLFCARLCAAVRGCFFITFFICYLFFFYNFIEKIEYAIQRWCGITLRVQIYLFVCV